MKCAVYVRVSTADKSQDPETQLMPLRDYVAKEDWEVEYYVEEGVSGAKESRPVLDKLMTAIRRNQVDILFIWKLDRIGRSCLHLLQLLKELDEHKVRFKSYTDNIDTGTPEGKLFFTILAAFAEYERTMIAERVKAGMARSARQGKHMGRPRYKVTNKKVIQAYIETGSIRGAARVLGINPGIAYNRLKEEGVIKVVASP